MPPATRSTDPSAPQRRAYWLKLLHQWHWLSASVCLVGMLVFSATGITLNHAAQIGATPEVTRRDAVMPADVLARLGARVEGEAPLPPPVRDWLVGAIDVATGARPAEWSDTEVYVSLARPGGDAWMSIDRETGDVLYERTDRGWVSYFNDLHKGRNTGTAWSWFIDVFAIACVIFTLTGLFLLQMHARHRPATWPMVVLGLLVPALLAIIFIH